MATTQGTGTNRETRKWLQGEVNKLGGYRARYKYVAAPLPGKIRAAKAELRRLTRVVKGWDAAEAARKARFECAAGKARQQVVRAFYTGQPVAVVLQMMDAYRAKWERSSCQ